MSRSYKKTPCFKDGSRAGTKKYVKKMYNKKLRREGIDIQDGGSFKKYNQSYDISDYSYFPDPDDPVQVYRARMK